LELRRLRYFVAVAQELHFGRAALRLQIAQPALSQQIRKLEGELGVELFHRARGKGVTLTTAGEVLLEEGVRVLQRADAAATATRSAARGEIGSLRVGFAPSSAVSVLPLGVRSFRERRPHVRLQLEEMLSDELADAVRRGDVDVALIRAPGDRTGLVLEVVTEEQLFVAVPGEHRLAGRSRVTIRALADEPLIASSPTGASGWHRDVFALYEKNGLAPSVAHEISTIQAQLGFVAAGLGIALLPSSIAELHTTGVSMIPVAAPLLKLYVARADSPPSPALEQFIDAMREAGREWTVSAARRNRSSRS
jgi:DNA-binding transcriptional LysR family regulator